ncbi:glycoside hydrolase superfamily [Halteromyces radiatus]|uniref:glycoside hydrolase superfamily n=1 Tax=Halteromyces radiatus TaxID=101107 RepID=UPI0022200492|nr:glycoside hydrolase superfamily [Halteromyces radiatus]KAI8093011.1 glycoside hydrolase superfamily [Halteromyces radiatus]
MTFQQQQQKLYHPHQEEKIEQVERKKSDSKRFSCGLKIIALIVFIILGVLAALLPFLIRNHLLDDNNDDTGWHGNHHDDPHNNNNSLTNYKKDPRLSRSFWGIDYTPLGAQMEFGCSVTQEDVIEDLKLLHQLTPRLRLYGLDCNQAYYVMNGMKMMNIDMGIILTIWVDGNSTTYDRQYNAFWTLLDKFGADHITGVSVGNEALFRQEIDPDELIQRIRDVKSKLQERGYGHIPVYTTDIRSLSEIMPEEDQVLDNVHPFFAGVQVEQATTWTWKYFKDVVIIPTIRLAKSNGHHQTKPALISEVGWPTEPESRSEQAAIPSLSNLETLLFSFVCQSNEKGVPYYWFEFKDAPWKNITSNEPREAFWGLFDQHRQLKVSRLPHCPLPSYQKQDVHVPLPKFDY